MDTVVFQIGFCLGAMFGVVLFAAIIQRVDRWMRH